MADFNLPVNLQPTCVHLRHKLMYVDERQQARGFVDDSSDTRIFFCMCSQHSLGPDDEPVSPQDCQDGRTCFARSE